jgi:hypothetical protein
MKRFVKLPDTAIVALHPAGSGQAVRAAEALPEIPDILAATPPRAAQTAPCGSRQRPMPVTARPSPTASAQRH